MIVPPGPKAKASNGVKSWKGAMVSWLHVWPEPVLRKIPAGAKKVAYTVPACEGSAAMATRVFPLGTLVACQFAPPFVLIKSPWSVPAYKVVDETASTASTNVLPTSPVLFVFTHVVPPSALLKTPIGVAA